MPGTSAPEEYVPAPLVVAWTVCPVGPVMVTLALGTTAPVASVTVPEMLPFDTEVWANATEHNSSANKATSASSVSRALRRGELNMGGDFSLKLITSSITLDLTANTG